MILLHHSTKANPANARGSSALQGAADCELTVAKGWRDPVTEPDDKDVRAGLPLLHLAVGKMKNGGEDVHEDLTLIEVMLPDGSTTVTLGGATGKAMHDLFDASAVESVVLPEAVVDVTLRVYAHILESVPQGGATAAQLARDVPMDTWTARQTVRQSQRWARRIAEAIDLGLQAGVLAHPASSNARWTATPWSDIEALRTHLITVQTSRTEVVREQLGDVRSWDSSREESA